MNLSNPSSPLLAKTHSIQYSCNHAIMQTCIIHFICTHIYIGKYAQTLRQILRQMHQEEVGNSSNSKGGKGGKSGSHSKGANSNSNQQMQLKSLEEVLRLGKVIAEREKRENEIRLEGLGVAIATPKDRYGSSSKSGRGGRGEKGERGERSRSTDRHERVSSAAGANTNDSNHSKSSRSRSQSREPKSVSSISSPTSTNSRSRGRMSVSQDRGTSYMDFGSRYDSNPSNNPKQQPSGLPPRPQSSGGRSKGNGRAYGASTEPPHSSRSQRPQSQERNRDRDNDNRGGREAPIVEEKEQEHVPKRSSFWGIYSKEENKKNKGQNRDQRDNNNKDDMESGKSKSLFSEYSNDGYNRGEGEDEDDEIDQIGSDSDSEGNYKQKRGEKEAYKVRADARLPGSGRGRMSVVERANPNIYRPGADKTKQKQGSAQMNTPLGPNSGQGGTARQNKRPTTQVQTTPGDSANGVPVVRRFHTPGSIPGKAPIKSTQKGPKTVFGHRM